MISNLREVPHFADIVASRGWHAWWTDSGVPLHDYRAHLNPMLDGQGVPFCLVAHEVESYLGSCLVIESDLEARPLLTPWIAALWVDAEHREKGIARSLMREARELLHGLNVTQAYLCAEPRLTDFYQKTGWSLVEPDVTGLVVFAQPCCS